MATQAEDWVIPKGSLVLITGANGFLGSHVVEQFLEFGFKVRGTVRNLDRLSNLERRWDSKYPGLFQAVEIPDLTKEGCYAEAIKGVAAFVHTAADVTFTPDYEAVVGTAVNSTLNALRTAAAEPSIKRFVLTSSYVAAAPPQVGKDGTKFDANSWNEQVVEMTKSAPKDHPLLGPFIYMTSKVKSEQAAWDFMKEAHPSFALNTVLPAISLGELFDDKKQWGSTSSILRDVFLMKGNDLAKHTPIHMGLLHVGGVVLKNVENERLFGVSEILTWNDMLANIRRLYPGRETYDDFDERRKEISYYDTTSSLACLKELGRSGWKPMDEAIQENLAQYA